MFIAWGPAQTWFYNDAFIPILGVKHPAALGLGALDEVWCEARETLSPMFARVYSGEPVHMQEFCLQLNRRGELEDAYFAFSYIPARDESGLVAGLVGACIETTDRVLAEKRQAAAQARQQRMFEQAPGFMCIFRGADHIFEFVNNAHRQLFDSESWIGRPVREAFPDIAKQGYYELLDKVYATGERYVATSALVRYRRAPGQPEEERLLDFVYEPITDDSGRVTGIFCEGFDVTEKRRVEQALRDSDRRKEEFIATLSHELRNPLAPLRNALALLLRREGQDAETVSIYKMMERQVHQLVRLMDDLLDVSRINHGKLELQHQRLELASLVRDAIETCEHAMREADLRLDVTLPSNRVCLHGDPVRLGQILANLLNNAIRFTPRGGCISVNAHVEAGFLSLVVSDTGIGFDADITPRLFEMFNRGQHSTGLGIGLALSQHLAEMHGGTIRATSPGAGCGAEFTVRLPISSDQAPDSASASRGKESLCGRRVLVVDDNRDAAESLQMLLEFLGAETRVALDGKTALALFHEYDANVVLLDIGMPDMDGYEVARAMRDLDPDRNTQIVALTGWGTEEDRRRAREAGFDHHLVKPADVSTVQALFDSFLNTGPVRLS